MSSAGLGPRLASLSRAAEGLKIDLTGLLLAQVHTGQPGTFGAGVLPLLSHALDQAWQSRTGQAVTPG